MTSEVADVTYKCSSYYDPEVERAIAYDDPDVGIEWPAGLELTGLRAGQPGATPQQDVAPELPF